MSFEDLVGKALEGELEKNPEELLEGLGQKKDELEVSEDALNEKKSGPDSSVTSAVKGVVKGAIKVVLTVMGKDSALDRMEEKNPQAVEKIKGSSPEQLEAHIVDLKRDIEELKSKLAKALSKGSDKGDNDKTKESEKDGKDDENEEDKGLKGKLKDDADLKKISDKLAVGSFSDVGANEISSSGVAMAAPSKEEGRSQ